MVSEDIRHPFSLLDLCCCFKRLSESKITPPLADITFGKIHDHKMFCTSISVDLPACLQVCPHHVLVVCRPHVSFMAHSLRRIPRTVKLLQERNTNKASMGDGIVLGSLYGTSWPFRKIPPSGYSWKKAIGLLLEKGLL